MDGKVLDNTDFKFNDNSLDSELDDINLDDFDLDDDDFDDMDDLELDGDEAEQELRPNNVINIDDINSGDIDIEIDEEELEREVLREIEQMEDTNENSLDADIDGSIMKKDLLMGDVDTGVESSTKSFISDTGDIVVMDPNEKGDNFKLIYVDIENIAIVPRIRKNKNVEDLVRSIKSTGLLKPIIVSPTQTDGIYVLIDGFRRIVACAKTGIRKIPCIVNTRVNTPEIPILEALYNHSKEYSVQEVVDYIDYLEKQKGIMSASMIEYLLQMNSGDYTKIKT